MNKNELDYKQSLHCMAIQNSQYIKIENNRERIYMQHQNMKNNMQLMHNMGACNQKLNLRFCKDQEVFEKQRIFL